MFKPAFAAVLVAGAVALAPETKARGVRLQPDRGVGTGSVGGGGVGGGEVGSVRLQPDRGVGGGGVGSVRLQPDRSSQEQDWPFYGGDQGGTKYSTLADINASTVTRLSVAWEWNVGEKALAAFGTRPGDFQVAPLMIGGRQFVVIATGGGEDASLVAFALDQQPSTGGQQ
jgi:hypothetical protein